ncbi:glycerate kinase type-2 family protein [Haematobacter genomosp. 1]|uniref:Glycerate kinase n=1 Tax=Haematobacter genomosp. 1 TaxID=366618 RepID=A0A212AD60_9RHOB|nr:DUF4147 domain-containing protein [Haematobacter genomosp. 1]OWJ78939.1 glycerate kinase [Haematobacter genomosp. 1]
MPSGTSCSPTVSAMRDEAFRLFEAGVIAADPESAVLKALPDRRPDLIVALGKAAPGMIRAAVARFGPVPAIVITHRENAEASLPPGVRLFLAGHPVPDEAGLAAGKAVLEAVSALAAGQNLLVLVSGGGSALLPAPPEGVTLADKRKLNSLLLASGADIGEMNLIRQQVSLLKGGGLARAAAPADVVALILSDVVGDDLSVIASGPTAAPVGTRSEARQRLRARGLWPDLPVAIRACLEREDQPIAVPSNHVDNRLVGSNTLSREAMARAAPKAVLSREPLTGDVSEAAARIMAEADGSGVWLWGGETTVRIRGAGKGGRNQELALRVALLAEQAGWTDDWVFLSAGTDGRDGPTEAAGGLVDRESLARMRAAGIDPEEALARNDSNPALAASGDLVITGATGTNVADLQVMIRA